MISHTFHRIMKGKFKPNELKLFCLITFILASTLLLISYLTYPNEEQYTILTHTLSYLGDYVRNPEGWVFFSIALVIMALSFSLLSSYIFHREILIYPLLAKIGYILLQIGCIGIILVALLPDVYGDNFLEDMSMGKAHNIVAVIAILGLLLGLIAYGVLFIIDYNDSFRINQNELYPDTITRYVFMLLAIGGFGMLISQIIVSKNEYPWPGPGILSFSLWEWIMTCNFFIVIYYLALVLPNEIPKVIKKAVK
jgi:hypothetical protein